MSHPVSGYMIVLNEERCIKASVYSILQYVDELLVLDGGSTDDTLNILRGIADTDGRLRIESKPQHDTRYRPGWEEPMRRNYCAQAVKHDWVLTIDADELLDDLPENFFRDADNHLVLNTLNLLNRKEYITEVICHEIEGGKLYWYPDPHVRYFNRTRFFYNNTPLHCYLMDSDCVHSIKTATWTNHDIWHYHAIVNPDRQLDNPEARKKLSTAPLTKPLPIHDNLMQAVTPS